MIKIARFHGLDVLPIHCYRCGWRPSWGSWTDRHQALQRCHLIDRWAGGLDIEPNLIPLCSLCHKSQPIFYPGDEDAAWEWMQGDPAAWIEHLFELYGHRLPEEATGT